MHHFYEYSDYHPYPYIIFFKIFFLLCPFLTYFIGLKPNFFTFFPIKFTFQTKFYPIHNEIFLLSSRNIHATPHSSPV